MKKKFLTGLAIATLLIAATTAHATTFNAAADFSLNSNPNGVWTYGYSPTLGGPFVLNTNSGTTLAGNPNFSYWGTNIGANATPVVFKNTAATNQQGGGANLDPGQIAFHPGPSGEFCIVRWTSPIAESILLNTIFTGRDNINGTTTDVHIFHNGGSLFDGLVNGFGLGSGPSFATSLSVLQGDTIDFAVGIGSNGTYISDTTGLDATITTAPVPVPATILLFGSGLAGLAGTRLRKKKK